MKKLVVYYSLNGNTKIVSEYFAQKTGADVYEIIEKTKRKGFIGFMKSGFQAVTKKKSKIEQLPANLLDGVSELTIATPVWASSPVPAVNAFLSLADIKGININVITVQADKEHNKSGDIVNYIKSIIGEKGAHFSCSYAFTGGAPGQAPKAGDLKSQVDAFLN